jgi:oligoendopeptidase F
MRKLFFLLLTAVFSLGLFAQSVNYKSREEIPVEYTWNFNDLYSGWDAWQADYDKALNLIPELSQFQGKLKESAENLELFFQKQEAMYKIIMRLYPYVSLQRSIDSKNTDLMSKMQLVSTLFSQYGMATSWVESEMIAIPKETMSKWISQSEYLNKSRFALMDQYRLQDFVLSAEKNEVLAYYSKALGSLSGTYGALANSDMEFPEVTLKDSSVVVASPVGVRQVMAENPNQDERLLVSELHRKEYAKNKNTYASIYSGILEARWASANARGFESCLEAAMSGDSIPTTVYTSLITTAGNNTQPLQKYLQLRKEALGLEKYYGSDGMVELVKAETKLTYPESKKLVLEAIKPLGDTYKNRVDFMLENRWIDVYETPGKEPGAYSLGLYGIHPFIMLNYAGTLDDSFTLAHELGHSMHSMFSNEKQPFATAQYSRFVAEVASTFNEHLLMDYLLKTTKDPNQRIALLVQQIENISGTFYTQAMFADYELQVHTLVEKGQPINEKILSEIWESLNQKYYGDAVEKTEYGKYNWARVMHFYELYYYVYQYATSYSASAKLSNDVLTGSKKDKQAAINRYIDFISAGGSDFPIEILKDAGVDLTTAEPFKAVVNQMNQLVNQLEMELRKAGKIK